MMRTLAAMHAPLIAAIAVAFAAPHVHAQLAGAAERAAARAAARAAEKAAAERAAAAAAARKSTQVAGGKVVRRWTQAFCGPKSPCPLPQEFARTFRGGSYDEVVLTADTTFYRVYSDPAARLGRPGQQFSYWSRSDARGQQAAIDAAIDVSRWGNTGQYQAAIRVPRGTRVFEGWTEAQHGGKPVGGGSQVVIEGVKPSWLIGQ